MRFNSAVLLCLYSQRCFYLPSEGRSANGLDGTMAVAVARAMKLSLDERRPVTVSIEGRENTD
jgi:hypothetical protein